jgi:hypothetical protein
MRYALFTLLVALLAACAMAVAPLKRVIVSYPNETPQSVVDSAMEAIEKAVRSLSHTPSLGVRLLRQKANKGLYRAAKSPTSTISLKALPQRPQLSCLKKWRS